MFKSEQQLEVGYRAWRQGRLDDAVATLSAVLEDHHGAWEAILPLARALAERGDTGKSIALLDDAQRDHGGSEAARSFRGLIHYDAGDVDAMTKTLAPLVSKNVLADALHALRLEEESGEPAQFPDGALWLADIAGRLLALREERLYASSREEADAFHHGLLAAEPTTSAQPSADDGFDNPRRWWSALDAAFQGKDYAGVMRVYHHKTAPSEWRDNDATALYAFSLLATDAETRVEELLAQRLKEDSTSSDLHFLRGLAWSRRGRRVEAAWCYTRAARLADTDLYYLLEGVSKKLNGVVEKA